MLYTCIPCNFSAPTRSRYERHLSTKKHARNTEICETISVQEDLVEDIQNDDIEQLYDDDIVNFLDTQGFHLVKSDDYQPIQPFFIDMNSVLFLQSLYTTVSKNKYLIYTIGFFLTLYSAVQDFINPTYDNTIEYVDCTQHGNNVHS